MKGKVLVCNPIAEEAVQKLKSEGFEVDKKFGLSKKELTEEVPPYHALMVRSSTKVRKNTIDAAKNLEIIARPGVGLDNIDVDYAEDKGIKVYNTPDAPSTSVAELVMTHILAAFRDIVKGTNSLRDGKWVKDELKNHELKGKKLGIIGYGNIGREIAKRAGSFDMDILAYDVMKIEDPGPAEMVDMEELLENSDVVVVQVPLNDATYHLIGEEEFEGMKNEAVFVDCSRGGVVDEDALYSSLKNGRIKFASKDVFKEEPPEGSKLFELENFHATPHIGAQTFEAQKRAGIQAAERIIQELG